jgi:hypothetical protein
MGVGGATMERWKPPVETSKKEDMLLARAKRSRKLFAFLRLHRHVLFDDAFQSELEALYRDSGAGSEPVPPAMLCMALIVQGYLGTSDAEAVELTVVDARWQMVLDRIGSDEPAFAQGTLQRFRERLIANDMDKRLLERTIELARHARDFDWKKLPKSLRVAVDSRPLAGAGRVEDTFNLLGHAGRKLIALVAKERGTSAAEICTAARTPLLQGSSTKAALDIDWNDVEQKEDAFDALALQVAGLVDWLEIQKLAEDEPLRPYLNTLLDVWAQDVEVEGDHRLRIRQGVAPDRRISIEDPDMRHGRKSSSKLIDGYKEHVATDVDSGLIYACEVTPANRPEGEGGTALRNDLVDQGVRIRELLIDRAYIKSSLVDETIEYGGRISCRAWRPHNRYSGLFTKADFQIDVQRMEITCPAGQTQSFSLGEIVRFDGKTCDRCELRSQCTKAAPGRGRAVQIATDEHLQKKLRRLTTTPGGRSRLRERTVVEHSLAHVAARKGPRARYRGTRRNLFDLRRASTIQNLETLHRVTTRVEQVQKAA